MSLIIAFIKNYNRILFSFYFEFSAQNILEQGFNQHYSSIRQIVLPLIGRKVGILDFEKLQNPETKFQLIHLLSIINLALILLSFSAVTFIVENIKVIFKRK